MCFGYFGLHPAFEHAIAGSARPAPASGEAFGLALGLAIVAVFVGLIALQHLFMRPATPLQVHPCNRLYVDVLVTRLMTRLWPVRKSRPLAQGGRNHEPE